MVTQSDFDIMTKRRVNELMDFNVYYEFVKGCSLKQKRRAYERVVNFFISSDNTIDNKGFQFIFEMYAPESRKILVDYLYENYTHDLYTTLRNRHEKIERNGDEYLIDIYDQLKDMRSLSKKTKNSMKFDDDDYDGEYDDYQQPHDYDNDNHSNQLNPNNDEYRGK